MKFQNTKQIVALGSAASLALLLFTGPGIAAPNNGGNNKGGASIGVTNHCALAQDPETGKPVLRITNIIINKSSGDVSPDFSLDGSTARAKEKGSGKGEKYQQVGSVTSFTAALGSTDIDIQLCDENGYLGPDNTVSLNASVSINVDNDNKGEYASRCSDDPETPADEGKVVVSAAELDALCLLP